MDLFALHILVHCAYFLFSQAFVFVVGGGNYIEYQNLQDYCARQHVPRRITYGTTELMDASEFLAQVG